MCSLSLYSCIPILMLLYYNMFCTGMNCKIYVKAETNTDILLSEKKKKVLLINSEWSQLFISACFIVYQWILKLSLNCKSFTDFNTIHLRGCFCPPFETVPELCFSHMFKLYTFCLRIKFKTGIELQQPKLSLRSQLSVYTLVSFPGEILQTIVPIWWLFLMLRGTGYTIHIRVTAQTEMF